ncbi:uncharacterized protein BXZ73DRAFT_43383 [Epithele typhae]|uniref:uncharacterized protein n=1 Tax=Epithele typhae TaxID=378194 RepID=UPI002008438C|nr:uncharacterized protein BXZ73DRAFT_43383 [Epithele typhae]KAH9939658.1 hypothetical protein BXZ73DRAFT_43383 [Epithele typhae]
MTSQNTDKATLQKLFPTPPPPPPSAQSPARFPGVTPESTATLLRTLEENHVKWHVFFNSKGFHNHNSHQLLAVYQLGANGAVIEAAYGNHASYMREAVESPEPITKQNFCKHLGDENFYAAYLKFFQKELIKNGPAVVLEEYIFSPQANIEPPEAGKEPMQMVNRFHSGLLHPMIHTGYGAEFGLPGMFAEGLAQTAVHGLTAAALTPPSILKYAQAAATDLGSATVSRLTSLIPSLFLNQFQAAAGPQKPTKGVHALTLLGRVLNDDYYSWKTIALPPPKDSEDDSSLERVLHLRGEALAKLVDEWTVDGTNAHEVHNKIEEIFWMNATIFGVGGWWGRHKSKTGKFNGDFLLLHLVTSSLFLPSLVAYLSPQATTILLRTHLLNSLAMYVARGRPQLPIADFMSSVTTTPAAPSIAPTPAACAPGTLAPDDRAPNPWLALLQSTVAHKDDHLCKLQRTLAHYAALYGAARPGHVAAATELAGADALDGTLFVRVAELAMDRIGWMREGEEMREWDFDAFYHD